MPKPDFVTKPLLMLLIGNKKILNPEYLSTTVEIDHRDGAAEDGALEAFIDSPRMLFYSSGHSQRNNDDDEDALVKYYGDADNMLLYASGKPITKDSVLARHAERCERWSSQNPFSSFMVDDKEGNTLGQTVLGASGTPGVSEYGILLDKKFQHHGYGTEATVVTSYFWAPRVAAEGFKVGGGYLSKITATAHPDNGTSKIFPRVGYKHENTIDHAEYGAKRNVYSLSIDDALAVVHNTRLTLRLVA